MSYETKLSDDLATIREILIDSYDLAENDADFILNCHAEDVFEEMSTFEYSLDAIARELIAAADAWGDMEDLELDF